MRTVYLHIGNGRCGSSAIQQFAAANRAALASQDLAYPDPVDMGQHGKTLASVAKAMVKSDADGDWRAILQPIVKFVASLPQSKCFLSSEFFYSKSDAQFRTIQTQFEEAGFRLHIIAYIREQCDWLVSRYAQAVKSKRWTMPLEEYLLEAWRSPTLNYLRHFEGIAGAVGEENLTIRLFDRRRLVGADVRQDVCTLLDVDPTSLDFGDARENAAAGAAEVEAMRAINGVSGASFQLNNRLFLMRGRRFRETVGFGTSTELYQFISPKTLNETKDSLARDNEAFRRRFFPQSPPPLFESTIPHAYQWIRQEDELRRQCILLTLSYFADLRERTFELA